MNVGGPAFLIRGLMERLNKKNFDQALVTGYCNSNESELPGVDGFGQVYRIDNLQREIDFRSDIISMLEIRKKIRSFKPQIVHTHTFKAGFLVRVPFLLLPKRNLILIHHYHGHLIEGYFGRIKKFIYLGIERILASRTNLILTDGNKVSTDLIVSRVGKLSKFRTITPGVEEPNPAVYSPRVEREHLVIGFVGRFAQIKRPDKFITLVEILYKNSPNLEFRMYGDGELRHAIEQDARQKGLPIQFFDFAKSAYGVLSEIDILLITSDNEGTPLTVMEASFVGVPCISTNVGAISEIIKNNVNGIVVENSVESLATTTLDLINNPSLLDSLRNTSRDFALESFSMKRYVEEIEIIYEELASSGFSK
jgi:glycosyltransferase involved in cell wall biosynthesis